jgi:hypothetical protein
MQYDYAYPFLPFPHGQQNTDMIISICVASPKVDELTKAVAQNDCWQQTFPMYMMNVLRSSENSWAGLVRLTSYIIALTTHGNSFL